MALSRNGVDLDMAGNALLNCSTINAMRPGERVLRYAQAGAGGTALTLVAISAYGSTGTATARPGITSIAGATIFQEIDKVALVSVATSPAAAQFRLAGAVYRPHAAGRGGFDVTIRCGASDPAAVAGARCFYGFSGQVSAGAFANANPSTFTNLLGVGADAGEATLSIFTNAGAGTATKLALGAAFPANSLSVDFYAIRFFCPIGILDRVFYEITNQTTGATVAGSLLTNLPVAGTALEPTAWRNNGVTALAVAVDMAQVTIIKFL